MAMSKQHQDALIKNRVALVKNVIIDEDFLSYMMAEKFILTENMKEEIESKTTRSAKVSKLLEILVRRGPNAMSVFLKALVYTHQEQISDLLDLAISKMYTTQRDRELNSDPVDPNPKDVVDKPTLSVEPEKSIEEKLADIQAGNDELLAPVHRLKTTDALIKELCEKMKLGSVYHVRSSRRGRVVIFSFESFVPRNLATRTGNKEDVDNLQKLFHDYLQFDVEIYQNKTKKEFIKLVENERTSEKLKNADIFVLIVLSHGTDGEFYAFDGDSVNIDQELVNKFDGNHCPALCNKPKLFLIQACQGDRTTMGAPLQAEDQADGPLRHDDIDATPVGSSRSVGSSGSSGLHEKADILVGKASVSGFAANRHIELGTLYIRCIVYVFSRKAHQDHVEEMLTEVANIMSAFKTARNEVFMSRKEGTFRKRMYFMPGFNGQ